MRKGDVTVLLTSFKLRMWREKEEINRLCARRFIVERVTAQIVN